MIRGKHIVLRTVRETDLDALFLLQSEVANRGDFYPVSLPSLVKLKADYQKNGMLDDARTMLLICKGDVIIGSMSFFTVNYFDALEIGYILYDPGSRNKGYVSEALAMLVKHLFESKKINRLQLATIDGNHASRRVAEKCGFRHEAVLRGAVFHAGKNHDLNVFGLLRQDLAGA